MPKLTSTEKLVLEKLFAMDGGYVLNFSDRTFAAFFSDELKIDIYQPKFHYGSGSKANRMRGFWLYAEDKSVAESIEKLLSYLDTQKMIGNITSEPPPQALIDKAHAIASRVAGRPAAEPAPSQDGGVSQARASEVMPDPSSLKQLEQRLLQLQTVTPHERGYAFERFLADVFQLYKLAPRNAFRLTGEQIDGSFQLGHDVYLLEAKWHNQLIGQSDLLAFAGKVEGKAQWSRGLFVSYSGYSTDGLGAYARGKSTRIVCMDGLDLHGVLTGRLSLTSLIEAKIRRAGETNEAYVSARELFPEKLL